MIHLLSSFDLKPAEYFAAFAQACAPIPDDPHAADMIAQAKPLFRRRVAQTPTDADKDCTRRRVPVMRFRDRTQRDAAYDRIGARVRPGTATHPDICHEATKTVFLCREDTDPRKDTA